METARLKTATRAQRRVIKKLGLETRVPLNIPPIEVDSEIRHLADENKITQKQYIDYFCKARWQRAYVPTFWSSIASLFKANYQRILYI
ncbi:MAG: hypothetical protein AABW47_03815 [Nanoarchaeota archaeon]